MRTSIERSLALRMGIAVVALPVALLGFVAAIWAVFVGLLLFFRVSLSTATTVAVVPTVGVILAVAFLESYGTSMSDRAGNATPVSPEDEPELHATVNRVASMLDVPKPTVAVSDSPAPEAMVVGTRPSSTRFVLSRGTLEALDAAELEAVVAHELAHVKNRDAAVMTVISVPTVLAVGLVARFPELSRRDLTTAVALAIVGLVGVVVTRSIVAVCSRTRELAADKAAAEVLGSGAPLASALRTLDRRIQETPSEDLRDIRSVSSLSILPLESRDEPLTYWEEAETEPFLWSIRRPLSRLFRTHPPTEERIERLAAAESDRAADHGTTRRSR